VTALKFISDLVARGRYCFGTAEENLIQEDWNKASSENILLKTA